MSNPALLATFELHVDPGGVVVAPQERRMCAEHARKEHLARISLRSAKVRKVRAELAQLELEVAADVEASADDGDDFWQAGQQAKARGAAAGGDDAPWRNGGGGPHRRDRRPPDRPSPPRSGQRQL